MKRIVTIQDQSRAITAITKEAPRKGMLAEFVKNAREAKATELHIDTIKIGKADKAILVNDGIGMDAETVKDMGAIFGSPKARNGKDENNYNTGARIMAIHNNEQGLAFTSKHNGVIRSIVLTVENGEYMVEDNDPRFLKDFGSRYGFKDEWTAVILMGNSVGQPTFTKPYGNLTGNRPFEEQLKLRFNDDGGVATFIQGKRVKFNNEKVPRKEWVEEVSDNVKIRYQLTDNPSNKLLTSKGECFAVEVGKGSNKFAASAMTTYGTLGAYAVQDELSITVELGEKYPAVQTNYRDALQNPESRERIDIQDFLPQIDRFMPKELREYIDAKEGKKKSRAVKSKARDYLRDHMRAMGLTLQGLIQSADGQEETENKKRKERKNKGTHPGGEENREKQNPTKGELKDGLPEMRGEVMEVVEDWLNPRVDLGYVMGKRCYINGNHPYIKKMEAGKKQSFAQYIADAYTPSLSYALGEEDSRSVILALGTTILAEGTFERAYIKDQKKG